MKFKKQLTIGNEKSNTHDWYKVDDKRYTCINCNTIIEVSNDEIYYKDSLKR